MPLGLVLGADGRHAASLPIFKDTGKEKKAKQNPQAVIIRILKKKNKTKN